MKLAVMSVLIISILCITDALPHVFLKLNLKRSIILCFILGIGVLYAFEIHVSAEFTLNISCPAILVLCAVLKQRGKVLKVFGIPLLTAFLCIFAACCNFIAGGNEISLLVLSLLTAISGLVCGGLATAFSVSAFVPVFAEIVKFIFNLNIYDYGILEFTDEVVNAQLLSLLFSAVIYEIYSAAADTALRRKNNMKNK